MRINQDAEHAERLVALDKTHAPHVGGQVVYSAGSPCRLDTVLLQLQVKYEILRLREHLEPLIERFNIHGPNRPLSNQGFNEMAADESTSTTYDD